MKYKRLITNRIFVTVILILIQLTWFGIFLWKLTNYSAIISTFFTILSIAILLYIIGKEEDAGFKIGWLLIISILPLLGGLLYLFIGDKKPSKHLHSKLEDSHKKLKGQYVQKEDTMSHLYSENQRAYGTSMYIKSVSDCPVYENTASTYYKIGEAYFKAVCEELEKAERFIFIEFFIISEGKMWNTILDILKRKANEGVDVRIIYDDMGNVALLPPGYNKTLERMSPNIHCIAFNPVVPFLSLVMNNRDHRKILVIDGHTAFNGGINLSDEYINAKTMYGHWKDTGVRIKGDAVWNFTLMFLEMWNAFRPQDSVSMEDYQPKAKDCIEVKNDGYVQPFYDTPLDDEAVGETVYIEILNQAKDYVYICTPYLIIDTNMKNALCTAAKRGVDVRLITPGIPDKKITYRLTRSNYATLLHAGVKIYEYTPGFIHAKSYVCDDLFGVIGTINMDYRSLYLHFECGTYLYHTTSLLDMKRDYLETVDKCRQVDIEDCHVKSFGRLFDAILRLFAPLF